MAQLDGCWSQISSTQLSVVQLLPVQRTVCLQGLYHVTGVEAGRNTKIEYDSHTLFVAININIIIHRSQIRLHL